jgi:hypothetical protein
MATEAVAPGEGALGETEAQGGRIDRFFRAAGRLPGASELWFLAAGVVVSAVVQAVIWVHGDLPWGTPARDAILAPVSAGLFLACVAFLNRTAVSVFHDFRPALGDLQAEDGYLCRLLSISDRAALGLSVGLAALFNGAYLFLVQPNAAPVSPLVNAVTAICWLVTVVALGILIAHIYGQLRTVSELSRVARNVDVFKPGPVNALSRLTAVGPIVLLAFVALSVLVNPSSSVSYVIPMAIVTGVAVCGFVLPLRVLHVRLAAQKRTLVAASQDRLKQVLERVHESVEADDMSRADQLNKTLASVLSEHDVLGRLSTWPWTTGTFRGVASAVLLPILIFVITHAIDRLI